MGWNRRGGACQVEGGEEVACRVIISDYTCGSQHFLPALGDLYLAHVIQLVLKGGGRDTLSRANMSSCAIHKKSHTDVTFFVQHPSPNSLSTVSFSSCKLATSFARAYYIVEFQSLSTLNDHFLWQTGFLFLYANLMTSPSFSKVVSSADCPLYYTHTLTHTPWHTQRSLTFSLLYGYHL